MTSFLPVIRLTVSNAPGGRGPASGPLGAGSVTSTEITNDGFEQAAIRNKILAAAIDGGGSLLVGVTSNSFSRISKAQTEGLGVLQIDGQTAATAFFYACNAGGYNVAATAVAVGKNSSTGRSINAGGTINASGADYAEYMTKADGCGTIEKGDVCGVDADGHLTKSWAAAVSFVVKSTDPAYVGGDRWGDAVGPAPVQERDESDEQFASRRAPFEATLEIARQKVDRIAFCGQVPVNFDGECEVGDYLIAVANGGGIRLAAVAPGEINFDQYRRRVGKVWAMRDGRPWISVQQG